jgi:predicted deacylase
MTPDNVRIREQTSMSDWKFPLVPPPAPGEKQQGHVAWGDAVLTGWDWPYIAVHGARPGPAVLVTAGVHGSEYSSIDAAVRLAAGLDARQMRGQVLCLPLLNPPAFWQRAAYVCPVDNLNLNRVFPGKPLGTFSERLAWHVTERAIRGADACFDLHGGDLPEALVPFTIYEQRGEPALDGRTRAIAEAFGLPAMMVQNPATAPISGPAYAAAARLGVPAIIAEDGGLGVCDPTAAGRLLAGAQNALRALGVLAGGARAMPPPRVYENFIWVRSRHAGFFKPCVAVGDTVAAGAVLGSIGDFFGAVREEITNPTGGQVLFLVVSSAIAEAGLICGIGAA